MKKLIIAAFAAMLGIAANAATVTWGMTTITDSPANTKAGGWIAYVIDASSFDAFAALDGDKVAAYAADNAIASGTTVNSRGAVTVTISGGDYAASSTASAFMVLFDNASAGTADYYAYTSIGETVISEGGASGNLAFGTFADATSATGGWQSTAAIPEPTSGLLMLLGMAGLALRRRRA